MLELGSMTLHFYGVAVALAAALSVLCLKNHTRGTRVDAVTLALFVLPCAFALARLMYCVVRFEFVFLEMGPLFALETWNGGFMLWGALAGGMLGAALYARSARVPCAQVLDTLACPAMLMITLCRAAEVFVIDEGRGAYLDEGFFCRFPFAVCNEYGEWQLAVFVWEAAAALVIFFLARLRREREAGDRVSFALMLYAACQVIFESLRMDSTPRFGFVRVSQVLAAVVLLLCVLWRSRHGGVKRMTGSAALVLAMAGIAGGLEWVIDKTPVPLPVCFAVMALAMGVCVAAGLRGAKRIDGNVQGTC